MTVVSTPSVASSVASTLPKNGNKPYDFYIHVLPQLKSMAIFIPELTLRDETTSLPTSCFRATATDITFLASASSTLKPALPSILNFHIQFPWEITPSTLRCRQLDSGLELGAQIADVAGLQAATDALRLREFLGVLHAKHIKSCAQIKCSRCQSEFIKDKDVLEAAIDRLVVDENSPAPTRFRRVFDIPADSWHELVDCWACHREDYSGLIGQKSGIIYAQPDSLLVGKGHLLLHPQDLQTDQFSLQTPQSNQWNAVFCQSCDLHVGEMLFSGKPGPVEEHQDKVVNSQVQLADIDPECIPAIRLFKYRVSLVLNNASGDSAVTQKNALLPGLQSTKSISVPFTQFFMDELLELADVHATYRWIISSSPQSTHTQVGEPSQSDSPLLLWLMSWNFLSGCPNSTHLVPTMKLLYCKIDDEDSKTLAQWKADRQVEVMQISPDLLQELCTVLKEGVVNVPSHQQQMGEFAVSFVQRREVEFRF